jgi:hypothetical protein
MRSDCLFWTCQKVRFRGYRQEGGFVRRNREWPKTRNRQLDEIGVQKVGPKVVQKGVPDSWIGGGGPKKGPKWPKNGQKRAKTAQKGLKRVQTWGGGGST